MRGTIAALLFLVLATGPGLANTITYQGQLEQSGAPFSGSQDVQFRLFDAPGGGNEVAPLVVVNDVQISQGQGQFQVELDFGQGYAGISAVGVLGDQGTFVWADRGAGLGSTDFVSTGSNQFLVRSRGSMGINTNVPTVALTVRASAAGGAGSRAARPWADRPDRAVTDFCAVFRCHKLERHHSVRPRWSTT